MKLATKSRGTKEITIEQAEDAIKQYTEATTNLQKIESQKRMEITDVESRYSRDIDEYNKMQMAAQEILETYGKQIALDTATNKKSTKLLGVTIGFRAGQPKLSVIEGFDWDKALEAVRKTFPRFIRKVEELDKKKLLKEAKQEELESVGLAIGQSNSFYVKLD